jgi:CheY-like chemotaxis protein
LCDLNLAAGGVSGTETAERILSVVAPRKLPVIFITGDLVPGDAAGPSKEKPLFLQKPFRISEVLSMLADLFAVSKESLTR